MKRLLAYFFTCSIVLLNSSITFSGDISFYDKLGKEHQKTVDTYIYKYRVEVFDYYSYKNILKPEKLFSAENLNYSLAKANAISECIKLTKSEGCLPYRVFRLNKKGNIITTDDLSIDEIYFFEKNLVKKEQPTQTQNSLKYADPRDYVFCAGDWYSLGIIEKNKAANDSFYKDCKDSIEEYVFVHLYEKIQKASTGNMEVMLGNDLANLYALFKQYPFDINIINNVIFKEPKLSIYKKISVVKSNISKVDTVKLEQEKKKMAEEKKKKVEAKKKEEEERKRIAEAKKKEQDEQKYRILVQKYGDDCKNNSLGSPEFNKCLKDLEAEDLLKAKLEREYLESLTPEEKRAYTCTKTFGFKKGKNNFKDCIFKLYATELELQKLDLEKQLALAKVEAERAKAETARAQIKIIQARADAARAEGKLQEAQIQATNAQTYIMQQQAAAAKQQAAAAEAQAKSIKQRNSINLMMQGLNMLSGGNQNTNRLRTNCTWNNMGWSCR